MSQSGTLFSGLLASFVLSLGVSVVCPYAQIAGLKPNFKEDEGLISEMYPVAGGGLAEVGKAVYISQGCQACHTQIVRGPESADIDRGWGQRRTVARDYILEEHSPFGALRIGPDLSNIGSERWRNEQPDDPKKPVKRDAAWHLTHLYNPTAIHRDSVMPSYKWLFEVRKVTGVGSPDAVKETGESIAEGYEVVPSAEAKALVAYLLSLDHSHTLKEAGIAVAASQPKK